MIKNNNSLWTSVRPSADENLVVWYPVTLGFDAAASLLVSYLVCPGLPIWALHLVMSQLLLELVDQSTRMRAALFHVDTTVMTHGNPTRGQDSSIDKSAIQYYKSSENLLQISFFFPVAMLEYARDLQDGQTPQIFRSDGVMISGRHDSWTSWNQVWVSRCTLCDHIARLWLQLVPLCFACDWELETKLWVIKVVCCLKYVKYKDAKKNRKC